MAKRRILYLVSLIGCLVFYYSYREWFSWFLLMLMLWLPAISLLLSLPAILTAHNTLQAPNTLPLGQTGHAVMGFTGPLPMPQFRGKLRLQHAITGQTWTLKLGEPLPAGLCGRLRITVVKPRLLDYLGLFRLPVRQKDTAFTYIWPESIPLDHTPDFARLPPRQWKPKPGGGFAENHELRLYRPGDNLQQIHWKLSAKTGKLILRESMEPIHKPIRLTLDLNGTQDTLNRKLGNLLWLSRMLVEKELPFDIAALTDLGILTWHVTSEETLTDAMRQLLSAPAATVGSIQDAPASACRLYHIGGTAHEE